MKIYKHLNGNQEFITGVECSIYTIENPKRYNRYPPLHKGFYHLLLSHFLSQNLKSNRNSIALSFIFNPLL